MKEDVKVFYPKSSKIFVYITQLPTLRHWHMCNSYKISMQDGEYFPVTDFVYSVRQNKALSFRDNTNKTMTM